MDNDVFIAIDPGKNGGIAWRDENGVWAIDMPGTARDLVDALRGICVQFPCVFMECVIERVHAMPRDGSASAFAFGENFGMLQGVLAALGIPYRFVTPQTWQRKVGALPKEKKDRKNAIKEFAQQRHPRLKITLKTADALAILTVEDKK